MGSLLDFTLRVVSGFNRSQGLLLSGAVAYYTLLPSSCSSAPR